MGSSLPTATPDTPTKCRMFFRLVIGEVTPSEVPLLEAALHGWAEWHDHTFSELDHFIARGKRGTDDLDGDFQQLAVRVWDLRGGEYCNLWLVENPDEPAEQVHEACGRAWADYISNVLEPRLKRFKREIPGRTDHYQSALRY